MDPVDPLLHTLLSCISSPSHQGRDSLGRDTLNTPILWGELQEPAIANVLMFSLSVMSNSLRPHGLQHSRLTCPSLSPRVCSNSCPWSGWCHPTIPSSITLFSSCPQSFPASGSFPMSWPLASGGQSIGASSSVLPMNSQSWFPLGLILKIILQEINPD